MSGNIPTFCAAKRVVAIPLPGRARFSLNSCCGGGSVEVAAQGGTLLGSISDFCQRTGMAESTFGRRAVNDGKFVARLRDGARVTPETLQRVNQSIERNRSAGPGDSPPQLLPLT